jgi:hypothetical protein
MGTWNRGELEAALEHYQSEVRRGIAAGDWSIFADLFTEDAIYIEHAYGRFHGRDQIRSWITTTMATFPGSHMPEFPINWYVVDEGRGWIVCEVANRMADPGDGSVHEASNLTVLHYAGDHLFSLEEDVYNPMDFLTMVKGWIKRAGELGNLPPEASSWLQSVTSGAGDAGSTAAR